jgi:hypothetical protein
MDGKVIPSPNIEHPETTVDLWDFHIIATIEWQIGLVV